MKGWIKKAFTKSAPNKEFNPSRRRFLGTTAATAVAAPIVAKKAAVSGSTRTPAREAEIVEKFAKERFASKDRILPVRIDEVRALGLKDTDLPNKEHLYGYRAVKALDYYNAGGKGKFILQRRLPSVGDAPYQQSIPHLSVFPAEYKPPALRSGIKEHDTFIGKNPGDEGIVEYAPNKTVVDIMEESVENPESYVNPVMFSDDPMWVPKPPSRETAQNMARQRAAFQIKSARKGNMPRENKMALIRQIRESIPETVEENIQYQKGAYRMYKEDLYDYNKSRKTYDGYAVRRNPQMQRKNVEDFINREPVRASRDAEQTKYYGKNPRSGQNHDILFKRTPDQ